MMLLAAERDPTVWVGPGLLGFVVIMALVVATILLWRNMNKQLKKVRFDEAPPEGAEGAERAEVAEDAESGENAEKKPNGQPTTG